MRGAPCLPRGSRRGKRQGRGKAGGLQASPAGEPLHRSQLRANRASGVRLSRRRNRLPKPEGKRLPLGPKRNNENPCPRSRRLALSTLPRCCQCRRAKRLRSRKNWRPPLIHEKNQFL